MSRWHNRISSRIASTDYIQSNVVLAALLTLLSLTLGCAGLSTSKSSNNTTGSALTIATASLPKGTMGVAYSSALSATGGTQPYTWAIRSGNLPAGLNLNS